MDGGVGRVQAVAFVLSTANWASAVYRSAGDLVAQAYLVGSYLAMLLLLYCVRTLDRAPPGRGRGRLKLAVWALSTVLTSLFSGKVAAIMPLWAGAVIWAMTAATVAFGLWALFARAEAAR